MLAMLKIRLQRVGRVHEPVFRLVVTDSKNSTKSGKSVEVLGSYDARRGDKAEIKNDRVSYWVEKGAQLSGTVHNLLVDRKIVSGKKINVLPLKKPIKKESETVPESVPVAETVAEAPVAETSVKEASA